MVITCEDWSLHRKGEIDRQRHREKVREAIKKNLADIVSEESIIMHDGRKTVRVPIRSLHEYHFRFNHNRQKHAGQGDGRSKKGDIVFSEPRFGRGRGAGNEPGVDYYEADITVDELEEMIFEDLGLPNLEQKSRNWPQMPEFRDIRKRVFPVILIVSGPLWRRLSAICRAVGPGHCSPEDFVLNLGGYLKYESMRRS